jgi:chitin disaccharide deacetylase
MLESGVRQSPASIRLVVNADGFGASAARNRGVLAAHRGGIVTSTAILGNAIEPSEIAATLKTVPALGTGLLLALTGGSPVAPAAEVPSLVDPQGDFPARPRDLLLVWAKAALRAADLEHEFDAQVARWHDLGVRIDHLATKDDLAGLPVVAAAAENVARRHGILGLRTMIEKPTLAWATDPTRGLQTAALGVLHWFGRRRLGALRHGPQTWGHFEAGRLDEIRLLEIVGRLGPGSHEIRCAPDLDEEPVPPRGEVAALGSGRVRAALDRRAIELCRWSDLF